MKKGVFALFAAAVMLTGCSAATTGKETEDSSKNNTASVGAAEEKFAKRDGMFIGYSGMGSLYTATGSLKSYVVSGKGKLILPLSDTYKEIIENNGKKYAMETKVANVEKVVEEEYDYEYYNYDNDYRIYDDNGDEVGSILGAVFANYIGDGSFYVCKDRENGYFIINPFTGSEEAVGPCELIYDNVNYKNVGILYMDEDSNVKSFSDASGEHKFDISGYNYGYGVSTRDAVFLCLQRNIENETERTADGEKTIYTENYDLYDFYGNKLNDTGYVRVLARNNCILAYDGSITHVLDGKTAQELYTVEGNVWLTFENGNYVVCNETYVDGERNETYAVVDRDGNILGEEWDSYDVPYGNDTVDKLVFGKEVEQYSYEKYVVDSEGKVLCGPVGDNNSWITVANENYYIVESYDTDSYGMSYNIYDYAGNEKYPEKDYKRFSYYYNTENGLTYYIMGYESPASNTSYLYEVLDEDMNVIAEGFKDINSYGMSESGYIVSVCKGFDMGIYDIYTGEWIYKQSIFAELED